MASILSAVLLALSCSQEAATGREPEREKLHPTIHQALENEEGPAEIEILIQIVNAGRPPEKTAGPQKPPPNTSQSLIEAHESFLRFLEEEDVAGSFEPVEGTPFVTATLPTSEVVKLVRSELVLFIGPHGEREIQDSRDR